MVHASSTVINKTSPKIPCNRGRHLVRIYSCLPRFRFIVNRPWIVPYRTDMNAVTRPSRGLRGHVAFPFLRRLSGVIFFVYGPSRYKANSEFAVHRRPVPVLTGKCWRPRIGRYYAVLYQPQPCATLYSRTFDPSALTGSIQKSDCPPTLRLPGYTNQLMRSSVPRIYVWLESYSSVFRAGVGFIFSALS